MLIFYFFIMKKSVFLIASVALALGFTSCENGKHYCWEVKTEYSLKYDDNEREKTETETGYVWNTKSGVDMLIDQEKETLIAYGCYDIKITKRKINKSESDCKE